MLSKRYLAIKKLLTKLSKIKFLMLNNRLLVLAQMYVDIDKGFRFSYMPDENGEVEFLDALKTIYDRKVRFFDVGSHFCTYTQMVLDRFDDCEGHLFEVTKTTYEKSLLGYGSDTRLRINNTALSDSIGEVEYRAYPADPSRNGISGVGPEKNFEYELYTSPCLTGSHYCRENDIDHIDLLKIDAEGYDLHVLKGFGEMLADGRIDVIQFEYTVKHSETHVMMRDYYEFLRGHDYLLGPLRQEGVQFKEFDFKDNSFELGPNYVACRTEFRSALARFEGARPPLEVAGPK